MDFTKLIQTMAPPPVEAPPPPQPASRADNFSSMPMGRPGNSPTGVYSAGTQEGFLELLRQERLPTTGDPRAIAQAIAERIQLYRQEAFRSRDGSDFSAKANILENYANQVFGGMSQPPGGPRALPLQPPGR